MTTNSNDLIAGLVDELEPVRPLRRRTGLALSLAAIALAVVLVLVIVGMRTDLASGSPSAMFLVSSGLFLMLGLATVATALTMASPRVGNVHDGWRWAAAMVGLLPAAALVLALGDLRGAWVASDPAHGLRCLGASLGLGLLVSGVLVLWLRRGAPTAPARAGLVTGIAGGAAGTFAFSLYCPHDTLAHIGLWHGSAVALAGLAGWLIVPKLVRW
jgi:hypothetical protein